ncbi:hypothetical protein BVRB_006950 [Beta vulgaris subsp. vulgaris]|uniref:Uncharacterized protein n=1 Tax=Beta vulgaris subsp. vulgaris TaxID=3555 RepID=A0A0J8B724_BETVV|nr:hypothetical protein BVRB_006950 [Beta vulgaris subsp. vulgaris]
MVGARSADLITKPKASCAGARLWLMFASRRCSLVAWCCGGVKRRQSEGEGERNYQLKL